MASILARMGFCALLAFGVAVLAVRLSLAYARRRGLLDQPGRRRSHRMPTPRGGGIGIVAACVLILPTAWMWCADGASATVCWVLVAGFAGVALIGWWDDHRPLSTRLRLLVQLFACGLFSAPLLHAEQRAWAWWPLLLLAGAWSVNLHNFMDGVDALLAQQAAFVGVGLALLACIAAPGVAALALVMAAASVGFWCYNRSPARIFMGDVGSGALGFMIFALVAWLWAARSALLWPGLILCSAFVADASLTLLSRMLAGRRWYAPHREHLYQWTARRCGSHCAASRAYLAWNFLVAAPMAWCAFRWPAVAVVPWLATYVLATATWCVARRYLLTRPRGLSHVPA